VGLPRRSALDSRPWIARSSASRCSPSLRSRAPPGTAPRSRRETPDLRRETQGPRATRASVETRPPPSIALRSPWTLPPPRWTCPRSRSIARPRWTCPRSRSIAPRPSTSAPPVDLGRDAGSITLGDAWSPERDAGDPTPRDVDRVLGGAPSDSASRFGGAADPARAPSIVYPRGRHRAPSQPHGLRGALPPWRGQRPLRGVAPRRPRGAPGVHPLHGGRRRVRAQPRRARLRRARPRGAALRRRRAHGARDLRGRRRGRPLGDALARRHQLRRPRRALLLGRLQRQHQPLRVRPRGRAHRALPARRPDQLRRLPRALPRRLPHHGGALHPRPLGHAHLRRDHPRPALPGLRRQLRNLLPRRPLAPHQPGSVGGRPRVRWTRFIR
jgi:hypothetical protein